MKLQVYYEDELLCALYDYLSEDNAPLILQRYNAELKQFQANGTVWDQQNSEGFEAIKACFETSDAQFFNGVLSAHCILKFVSKDAVGSGVGGWCAIWEPFNFGPNQSKKKPLISSMSDHNRGGLGLAKPATSLARKSTSRTSPVLEPGPADGMAAIPRPGSALLRYVASTLTDLAVACSHTLEPRLGPHPNR